MRGGREWEKGWGGWGEGGGEVEWGGKREGVKVVKGGEGGFGVVRRNGVEVAMRGGTRSKRG